VRVKLVEPGYGPYALYEQHWTALGRADPRGVRAFRAAHLRFIYATGCGDDRVRRGRGGVGRCERYDGAAPISAGADAVALAQSR
jgi:hypothetical protein